MTEQLNWTELMIDLGEYSMFTWEKCVFCCIWMESESESVKVEIAQSWSTLWPHRRYSPWNSPGQSTGVGSFSLLQGIFPIEGLNPSLMHCRQILSQLSRKGSPKILEWVAYSFSSRSSCPRNWVRVPCIAGGFFTNRAMREAHKSLLDHQGSP